MKSFNLEEYFRNPLRTVVTRDGRNVRIICTDKRDTDFPIVALVECEDKEETCHYTKNGCWDFDTESEKDLFFATEKREGWVNIFENPNNNVFIGSTAYKTKESAKRRGKGNKFYITTTKIEWEE